MTALTKHDWAVIDKAMNSARRGAFEQALEDFSMLEERTTDPRELATILLNEAQCNRMLGNFSKAYADCDRVLCLSTGREEDAVDAWMVKAALLVDEGRLSDALSVIDASLKCYPNTNTNLQLLRRGEILTALGEYEQAIPVLKSVLRTDEFDPSEVAMIHHRLGVSYGMVGQFDNASEHLLMTRSQPLPERYRSSNSFWLAKIKAQARDFRGAKTDLLDALKHADRSDVELLKDLYESLANVARELGDEVEVATYERLWRAQTQRR